MLLIKESDWGVGGFIARCNGVGEGGADTYVSSYSKTWVYTIPEAIRSLCFVM